MSISIYAYRTLLWVYQQRREDILAHMIPAEVLPRDETRAIHQEMAQQGWLHGGDEPLAGGPEFRLSNEGNQRAKRWSDDYPVLSAAHEILYAVPTARGEDLLSAEDAFDDDFRDPVTGDHHSNAIVEQATDVLAQNDLVTGIQSFGFPPMRLTLTQHGREVRREQRVPGLSAPSGPAPRGQFPMNQFHTHISGGTFGAAQFGQNNQANVGDVRSEVAQHFQTLRTLADNTPADDRRQIHDQIDQLESASEQGAETFSRLKNKLLSSFADKMGDRAVNALLAIPLLLDGAV